MENKILDRQTDKKHVILNLIQDRMVVPIEDPA